jgi:hypothetical protein
MALDEPRIGQMVHYVVRPPVCWPAMARPPVCWPAMVTAVDPEGSGQVLLTVFPPQRLPGYIPQPVPCYRVVRDGLIDSWHWDTDHEQGQEA